MDNGVGLFSENFGSCLAARSMPRAIQGNDGREGLRSSSGIDGALVPGLTLSARHGKGGALGPDVSEAGHRDFNSSAYSG